MDTATSVNRLRSRFLEICPERDLVRRIIQPYAGGEGQSAGWQEIYRTDDGTNLLLELQSPSVSDNFMESYAANSRRNRPKLEVGSTTFIDSDDETEYTEGAGFSTVLDAPATATAAASASVEHGSTNDTITSSVKPNTVRKQGKRVSRFARLFSGNANKKEQLLNQGQAHPMASPQEAHALKKNIFDMNFDYDKNLEDDDDDDDDDDYDADGNNIHDKFFQLEKDDNTSNDHVAAADFQGEKHAPGISNGNSTSKDGQHILMKKRSHFPQNMISRGSNFDLKNTTTKPRSKEEHGISSDNASTASAKQQQLPKKKSSASEDVETNNKNEDDDGENIVSDLESYIEEHDLDAINLQAPDISTLDKSDMLDQEENRRESKLSRNSSFDSSGSGMQSSYGKSLLYTDSSNDDFTRPLSFIDTFDSSQFDSRSMLLPSHSIPVSYNNNYMESSKENSNLASILDKNGTNVDTLRRLRSADHRGSNNSSKECLPNTTPSRRSSITSNLPKRHPSHSRRQLGKNSSSSKKSKKNNELPESYKGKLDLSEKSKVTSESLAPAKNGKTSANEPSLAIEKITDFEKKRNFESKLSSMFHQKKENKGNIMDSLNYFSFVAGSNVPQKECLDLHVFVYESKSYKRKPFFITVRKSATVFEVIGYIIYFMVKNIEFPDGKLTAADVADPNNFSLQIVDEDGEPFEDNFGKLGRDHLMQSVSDNEVVLCKVSAEERLKNKNETPLPYNLDCYIIDHVAGGKSDRSSPTQGSNDRRINQLSYYKPIIGSSTDVSTPSGPSIVEIKVYMYPNVNPKFNFTTISVVMSSKMNDVLVKYCKMKNMDPNEFALKMSRKNVLLDLNDTILRLDGHNEVEIISKKDARELRIPKAKPNLQKPVLPTIQSNDLTPLTLDQGSKYLKVADTEIKSSASKPDLRKHSKPKRQSTRYKLGLTKQSSASSNSNTNANTSASLGSSVVNGFFKSRNSSKTSLPGSLPFYYSGRSTNRVDGVDDGTNGDSPYQDLISGAYHKYKVWRRQQMSLINKHERTLALDGDYIYIVPPDKHMHWHENVKTKSVHISQVLLVKRSKRVPEYFKIFVKRGQDDVKRYYFEAITAEECREIVARIQHLLGAYKMNHK